MNKIIRHVIAVIRSRAAADEQPSLIPALPVQFFNV